MPTQETVEIISEMRKINDRLTKAIEYGLEVEVITFALLAMKENPSLSLSEALECGCREWDV